MTGRRWPWPRWSWCIADLNGRRCTYGPAGPIADIGFATTGAPTRKHGSAHPRFPGETCCWVGLIVAVLPDSRGGDCVKCKRALPDWGEPFCSKDLLGLALGYRLFSFVKGLIRISECFFVLSGQRHFATVFQGDFVPAHLLDHCQVYQVAFMGLYKMILLQTSVDVF